MNKRRHRQFTKIIDVFSDPNVKKWFLMNSASFPIVITVLYLYFVLVLGPKLMKNRKPFNIKRVIVIYNIAQVIFNAYLFVRVSKSSSGNLRCVWIFCGNFIFQFYNFVCVIGFQTLNFLLQNLDSFRCFKVIGGDTIDGYFVSTYTLLKCCRLPFFFDGGMEVIIKLTHVLV